MATKQSPRCAICVHRGKEIYKLIFMCKVGVNAPNGNHSPDNCDKFKKR